jgi:hypothetical protein
VVALQESGNLPQAAGPRQRLCHSKHTAKLIGKFYPLKRLICLSAFFQAHNKWFAVSFLRIAANSDG